MLKIAYWLIWIKLGLYILAGLMYASYKDEAVRKSNYGDKGLSTGAKVMAVLLWPIWLSANVMYNIIKFINK